MHNVMLVDVTDAFQDLTDAVAAGDRRMRKSETFKFNTAASSSVHTLSDF